MNQLEDFISSLNLTQIDKSESEKYEKLANYLFDGKGWIVLTSIYTRNIQLNEIVGEKLIDVLLHTCGKLFIHFRELFKTGLLNPHQHLLSYFDEMSLENLNYLNSIKADSASSFLNKFSLKLPVRAGRLESLFCFSIVCLDLFIRFNDGTNNSVLSVSSKTNGLFILNEFSEIIFNKLLTSTATDFLKLIYIKFLNKLFIQNYKNYYIKCRSSNIPNKPPSGSTFSHSLFQFQFQLIKNYLSNTDKNNPMSASLIRFFLKTCIEYIYNNSVCINLITFPVFGTELRQKVSMLRTAYYANINNLAFRNFLIIVNMTSEFLFQNIHHLYESSDNQKMFQNRLDFSCSDEIDNLDNSIESSGYWRKVCEYLVEMKLYKNYQEHVQICLRAKHTHASCKSNLSEIASRHNNLSMVSNGVNEICVFAELNRYLFRNLIEFSDSSKLCDLIKRDRLKNLIEKLGVCTCIKLSDLFEMHHLKIVNGTAFRSLNTAGSVELSEYFLEYYYSWDLCSIVGDYLVQISLGCFDFNEDTEENQNQTRRQTLATSKMLLQNQRRSTFFPLLLEETLKNQKSINNPTALTNNCNNNFLINDSFKIIMKLNEKSVLLCKYLSSTLLKYSKVIETLSTDKIDQPISDRNDQSASRQTPLKNIVYEIFYLFVKILKKFRNKLESSQLVLTSDFSGSSSDESGEKRESIASQRLITIKLIYEIISKYLNDFLTLIDFNIIDDEDNDNESDELNSPPSVLDNKTDLATTYSKQASYNKKLNRNLNQFISKNSIKIYENINWICGRFYQGPTAQSISIGSKFILFKQLISDASLKSYDKSSDIELILSKSLINIFEKNLLILDYDYVILDILLELFIKSVSFRASINESCENFHLNLVQCLKKYFNERIEDIKYLELLLDLIFVYFHFNRRKELDEIYKILKIELAFNPKLMATFFNVMILSKAFKLNKMLFLNDMDPNSNLQRHRRIISHKSSSESQETTNSPKQSEKPRSSTYNNQEFTSVPTLSEISSTPSSINQSSQLDYDADIEINLHDAETSPCKRYNLNGFITHSSYRYDLILFPGLLDLCLNYIQEIKVSDNQELIKKTRQIFEHFLKRLVHLLEACNLNIQILINNSFRQAFIQLIPDSKKNDGYDLNFIRYVFEIIYYLSLYDIKEDFLRNLFETLIDNNVDPDKDSSPLLSALQELISGLILRLTKNLPVIQSTHYIRMPYQINQEPIDYLLRTQHNKWQVNLNEYDTPKTPVKKSNLLFGSPVKVLSSSVKSQGFDFPIISHLSSMINESGQNFSSIKIPLNVQSIAQSAKSHDVKKQLNSYSLAFMLRFDNNLLNFAKSHGLNKPSSSEKTNCFEPYAHLISLKFASHETSNSCFEIWLNPVGNILFLRRIDQTILFTLNLMQLETNVWQFVYVSYKELEIIGSNKLNCNLSYSLNSAEIFYKEFEIQYVSPAVTKQNINNKSSIPLPKNSCLYIGHEGKNKSFNYLLQYDLGQVILSKDSNYTIENLLVLMHIMDTNISQLESLRNYEWSYLNGYTEPKFITNLYDNFNEYCEQIKLHVNVVYHPRNPHVYAIKPENCKSALTYVELITSSKSNQQCTLDIVLAKVGGMRQMVMLLAKLVEQEKERHKIERTNNNCLKNAYRKTESRLSSLNILESLLRLVNKRPNILLDFKEFDGFSLLQRIYTSIANFGLLQIKKSNDPNFSTYFGNIQIELFSILMNSCFQNAVISTNSYMKEKIEISCSPPFKKISRQLSSLNSSQGKLDMNLINGDLLASVILEWTLWQSFESSRKIWNHMFQILDNLLENNSLAQMLHSTMFIRFKIIEKIMNFLLDANEEQYVFEENSCQSLINIFKHFNSINSNNRKTKELFSDFFEYLHILHPENKAYIVYATNHFYYNLTMCLPSIPISSLQEYKNESLNEGLETKLTKLTTDSTPITLPESPKKTFKRQTINLDQFQVAENEKNFQQISASLMGIMYDMITVLPDFLINEILNLLKYESFIMFAMDENQPKRFEAFRIFITLIERSSATSFFITSSLVSITSAAGTVATIASNPTSSQSALRNFEQQNSNLSVNKENLIYAMCNQLNQFDQTDERFAEFCISVLINQPFTFKYHIDEEFLKSSASHISTRASYVTILISLLYSTRKNIKLCENCIRFITILLKLELCKIDFLVSKSGLLQVLFNLLRYFSDTPDLASTEFEIITDMKKLFSLITRLLIRLNETQDVDNFNFYLNSIVSLSYDSSNIGYEKFNHNLKSIVLNIVQSIMSDLNSLSAITTNGSTVKSGNTKPTLLKKIIMPLISPIQQQTPTDGSLDSDFTVFDSDLKFQKFIVFLVDFIHIIYDKISDSPLFYEIKSYDLNDELSIFSFSILIHSLSMGLEHSQKTRFSNLFRTNLPLIRSQFRRMFIFMMHPNHKIHTRLQLIKRLLNTSNCELIMRCILSDQDVNNGLNISNNNFSCQLTNPVGFNSKLSFYLNALMNNTNSNNILNLNETHQNQQISNNDKEILIHLDEVVAQAGLDYKNEFARTIALFSKNNSGNFYVNDADSQSYLLSKSDNLILNQIIIDLLNQCDKEFDEEILKIYYRTNHVFKRFLKQFERLTEELNVYAVNLTNQVCSMHSNVRKAYLQRLKNKRIHAFDIKQKWVRMIENMTHEKCVWHDWLSAACSFQILDQTEGLNRERRRLRKSHLYMEQRFFKSEKHSKLANEKRPQPLKYLLCDYELNNIDGSFENYGMSTGDYMLYYLKNSEVLKYPCSCKNVMPYCEIKGELLLSESRIYFAADEKEYSNLMGIENVSYSWSYDDVREIHLRRYLLKDIGFELFLVFGHTILLAFDSTQERNSIYKFISTKLKNLVKSESIDEATNLWRESKISNFEYLMQLNKYSGRTFNDLMQYPVFPHILSNYSSETLDMSLGENYRDLSRPIAIQNKDREEKFLQTYRMLKESSDETYHYASLYSNSGTVLHYLVRLPPFTKMFLDYQDNNFDAPDRTFHSMKTCWLLSSNDSSTDYKELIPEFFFLHEFLTNKQSFNFGTRQSGENIDNVTLPPWSKSNPRLFVQIMRQALESNYVTANLNSWIDLIFGYKQSGKAALDSINCYHPACYFGYPVEQIKDTVHRKAIETMIKTWGQTPKQLFVSSSHPQINRKSSTHQSNSHKKFENTPSIHRLILNIKWGTYVGSLDQALAPVCVYRENCKRNIVNMVSLPSNDVIGLAQNKCLLLDRASYTDTLFMALIEWGFNDDFIKTKIDGQDKPSMNLLPVRSNEHIITTCCCIGSEYLVLGGKSGLLSVYKLAKEKNLIQNDGFHCHLYGHKKEINDMYVCLAYSTMVTVSQEGLIITWDTNKLSFVNSMQMDQPIYKVCISQTTNDIACIVNNPNKLSFYTGNYEFINEAFVAEQSNSKYEISDKNENMVTMKSLCFSNHTEGLNVNVIAVGLSNGRIRLYSTWDLTLLRELSINFSNDSSLNNVGCIISLTFTKDRLYAADTYAKVYILESAYAPASLIKSGFSISGHVINASTSSGFLTNLTCFS